MKNLSFVIISFILLSCTGQDMEINKAKNAAETAIGLIGNKEFDKLVEMYSNDFSTSEPKEIRLQKFNQIIDATGTVQNFVLTDSTINSEIGEESRIILTYKVKHANLTTIETYKIGKESGNYVIAGINIQMAE